MVLGLSYAFSPRGYIVSEGVVLVKRLLGNARISLQGFREVRAADRNDLRGCLRLFGDGGLFGYYGLFRTSKLGKCSWYVTNRDKAVVLIAGDKTVVLSPDDVNGFVAAVRTSIPVPEGLRSRTVTGSMPPGRTKALNWKYLGVAAGILVVALSIGALLYSPGPPEFVLDAEELTIHDLFYPVTVKAAEVDIERIRVVDIDVDSEWRPTLRTNGFANLHYHSGWFRVAGGNKVRLYRADGRRLVLLPPKGDTTPVLLEARQPETFVQELRRAWLKHP
jgi:hypothetical protein